MTDTGREIQLVRRPVGAPVAEDFAIVEVPVPEPRDGEVVIRTELFSVDPYQRLLMSPVSASDHPLHPIGHPVRGGGAGHVVASSHPGFQPGDRVVHRAGWQEFVRSDGRDLLHHDLRHAPLSTGLGVLGLPGFSAWYGMVQIGRPQAGETVFVSSAAGSVGSVAGQLAKLRGARVIGSAGSPDKVLWLRELGFDGAFDYHATPVAKALRQLAPDGIDVAFDNVGGDHLEAAIGAARTHARIVVCGAVSEYNRPDPPPGPRNLSRLFMYGLTIQGFRQSDHLSRFEEFRAEVGPLVRDGKVRYRERVLDGIEAAPQALAELLSGVVAGKLLIRIDAAGDPPARGDPTSSTG